MGSSHTLDALRFGSTRHRPGRGTSPRPTPATVQRPGAGSPGQGSDPSTVSESVARVRSGSTRATWLSPTRSRGLSGPGEFRPTASQRRAQRSRNARKSDAFSGLTSTSSRAAGASVTATRPRPPRPSVQHAPSHATRTPGYSATHLDHWSRVNFARASAEVLLTGRVPACPRMPFVERCTRNETRNQSWTMLRRKSVLQRTS